MNWRKVLSLLLVSLVLFGSASAVTGKEQEQTSKQRDKGKVMVTLNGKPVDVKAGFSAQEKGVLSVSLESETDSIAAVKFYLVRGTRPVVYKEFTQSSEFLAIDLGKILNTEYSVRAGDRIVLEIDAKQPYAVSIPLHE